MADTASLQRNHTDYWRLSNLTSHDQTQLTDNSSPVSMRPLHDHDDNQELASQRSGALIRPCESHWQVVAPFIHDLYMQQNLSLHEVMEIMTSKYQFRATYVLGPSTAPNSLVSTHTSTGKRCISHDSGSGSGTSTRLSEANNPRPPSGRRCSIDHASEKEVQSLVRPSPQGF